MATPWLPLLALLLATALAPLAVDAPRAPSAVGAPLSGTAVASPPPPLPAAAAWGLALEPSCPASFVAAQVLFSCDPLLPTAGCCNALLGSVPWDDALPCPCAAAHDPDLQRAGYMEGGLLQLYGDCGGQIPAADDLHALCQEAHITQTIPRPTTCSNGRIQSGKEARPAQETIPQGGSAPHRRIQKELAGSCDASKLAWDVAAHCLDSVETEAKVTPSCCTPLLTAAESRKCFCTFLQELKVELSPISRKDAHLLHRRCGGLHPLPRCFSHRDEPQGQDDGAFVPPPAAGSPSPPTPLSPSPPAPALKQEPPAYAQFFWSVLRWVLSHGPFEAVLVGSAVVAAVLAWVRKCRKDRRARRRAAGTLGDKVADLGLQAAEIGLEAVAKKLEQKEQDSSSSPPLSTGTRSRGTSMDSSLSSEEDHKEEMQEEEEKTSKPQAAAPAASAASTIEASGWFSVSFNKWW